MSNSKNERLLWLHRNYIKDPLSSVSVADLGEKFRQCFGAKSTQNLVGALVRKVFPGITTQQKRKTEDWTKKVSYFVGLKERDIQSDSIISLEEIPLILPSGYFIVTLDTNSVVIGKYTGLCCNGNKITVEITITEMGRLQVSLGGKIISCGLDPSIELTKTSLSIIFSVVSSLRYCQGLPVGTITPEEKENCLIQSNKQLEKMAYSLQCCKVLAYTENTSSTVCCQCRKIGRASSCENEDLKNTDIHSDRDEDTAAAGDDFVTLLKEKAPHLTNSQIELIVSQIQNQKDSHSRKWNNSIIQLALSMWTRNPSVYRHLTQTGALVLPSECTLSRYKNSVQQGPGICESMLKWMHMQARHENLPSHGYSGGLILDEMAIQEDLQISHGKSRKLVGFVDVGGEAGASASTQEPVLANHVCQFMFHGLSGFRFLVAHYPTNQLNGPQLYSIFWDVVEALTRWDFHVLYTCLDGASNNRSFIKIHSPRASMSVPCIFHSAQPVIFLADPSHLFKKIRNNIMKSGRETWHTRLLIHKGNAITWKVFMEAYEWDKAHGLSIHHKLTEQHLHPNSAEKMRNHLAEDVLDGEMLHLMQRYSMENHQVKCQGAISLLQHTSKLIKFFRDRRPIHDMSDERLLVLKDVMEWFQTWEKTVPPCNLISAETREDINFLLGGFPELVKVVTEGLKATVIPLYINSDILENIFSQQRGLHHGAGSNPNYQQYGYATNSITLCQKVISKKANAARRRSSQEKGALPFKHLCKQMRL